jgi:hypothetical protein
MIMDLVDLVFFINPTIYNLKQLSYYKFSDVES